MVLRMPSSGTALRKHPWKNVATSYPDPIVFSDASETSYVFLRLGSCAPKSPSILFTSSYVRRNLIRGKQLCVQAAKIFVRADKGPMLEPDEKGLSQALHDTVPPTLLLAQPDSAPTSKLPSLLPPRDNKSHLLTPLSGFAFSTRRQSNTFCQLRNSASFRVYNSVAHHTREKLI
jgi:hypothetical protein